MLNRASMVFSASSPTRAGSNRTDKLPNVPEWDEHQRLAAKKKFLVSSFTGHPLEKYKDKIADFRALDTEAISNMKQGTGKDETTPRHDHQHQGAEIQRKATSTERRS